MALPTTVREPKRVDSLTQPGRVYLLQPLTVASRPHRKRMVSKTQLKIIDLRRQMNDLRVQIDFSAHFSTEECALIKDMSDRLNQRDSERLTVQELALLRESDSRGILIDEVYEGLYEAREEALEEYEIQGVVFFLTGVEELGEVLTPDSHEDSIHFLRGLSDQDLNLLQDAVSDFADVSAETEKNSVPSAT